MEMIKVEVLRAVRVAESGNVHGREIVKGTSDEVPADVFPGLEAEGYVARPGRKAKEAATLREDGPTIAEYVAAGYPASTYPPHGYVSRSTPEEIAAAIETEKGRGAPEEEASRAELGRMTNAQLFDIAKAEEIAVESDNNKATLVDRIIAGRAAKASASA